MYSLSLIEIIIIFYFNIFVLLQLAEDKLNVQKIWDMVLETEWHSFINWFMQSFLINRIGILFFCDTSTLLEVTSQGDSEKILRWCAHVQTMALCVNIVVVLRQIWLNLALVRDLFEQFQWISDQSVARNIIFKSVITVPRATLLNVLSSCKL